MQWNNFDPISELETRLNRYFDEEAYTFRESVLASAEPPQIQYKIIKVVTKKPGSNPTKKPIASSAETPAAEVDYSLATRRFKSQLKQMIEHISTHLGIRFSTDRSIARAILFEATKSTFQKREEAL